MSLIGAVLLICLDRRTAAPRWKRPATSSEQTTAQDFAQYHTKTFAVVRVVDGDTLYIEASDNGAATTTVRLLGIDAPELSHGSKLAMYFAHDATQYARQLTTGLEVTVYLDETGRTRGTYGRLLAYIEMPDGRFLNELLVSEGYAYADPRFAHSYHYRYQQLERSAAALKKGLWAEITPERMPAWHQRRPLSPQP